MYISRTQAIMLHQFFLAIFMLAFSYLLITLGVYERKDKKAFDTFGIRTTATLIGYRYIANTHRSPPGDRPVYSYISNDHIKHTYVAYEYGFASDVKKSVLATQKVEITYLSNNPNVARIEAWGALSDGTFYITTGIITCVMSFVFIYVVSTSLPNPPFKRDALKRAP